MNNWGVLMSFQERFISIQLGSYENGPEILDLSVLLIRFWIGHSPFYHSFQHQLKGFIILLRELAPVIDWNYMPFKPNSFWKIFRVQSEKFTTKNYECFSGRIRLLSWSSTASLKDKMARRAGDIEILPWKQAVEVYKKL